jgi:hypothetical protein
MLAVDIAGLFAKARERGIEPQFSDLARTAHAAMDENGRMNTEFHYAFQLTQILKRIGAHTFVFEAAPVVGKAPKHTLDLLEEATRCFLFGLMRACVAACRAVVEDCLEAQVPTHKILEAGMRDARAGHLERLIDAAKACRVLRPELCLKAHEIRRAANKALHAPEKECPMYGISSWAHASSLTRCTDSRQRREMWALPRPRSAQ